jgi:tail tube protein
MGNVKGGVEQLEVSTGVTFDIDTDAKYNIQSKKDEDIVAANGLIGHSRTGQACFIEGNAYLEEGQTVDDLYVNGTVKLIKADRIITLSADAKCTGDGVVDADNKVAFRFSAKSGKSVKRDG